MRSLLDSGLRRNDRVLVSNPPHKAAQVTPDYLAKNT